MSNKAVAVLSPESAYDTSMLTLLSQLGVLEGVYDGMRVKMGFVHFWRILRAPAIGKGSL